VLSLPVLALVPHVATKEELQRARVHRWTFVAAGVTFVSVSSYVFWAMQLWKHVI
jgi:hypothetical protein